MKPNIPMTGIQEAVYVTYKFDCSEKNARQHVFWSIRRAAGDLFDLRGIYDKIRYRRLVQRRREVRTDMVIAKLKAKPKLTRRLMAIDNNNLPMLLRRQAE